MADVTNQYYAGEAFIGYGSQLLVGQNNGSPETFVAVAGITSIQPGEMTANVINKTHLRSPGRAHEKISTIRDIGAFTINGNAMPTHGSQSNAGGDGFTSGGLLALHRSQEERNFKIVLADGSPATELPFRGVVSSFQWGEIGLEGLVNFTCQIQPLADYTADLP